MTIETQLMNRSHEQCELCGATPPLSPYNLQTENDADLDNSIYICQTCGDDIAHTTLENPNHWRCLNDSMWSETIPVKAMAWRLLNRLVSQGDVWAQDLLDMLYLEDEVIALAKSGQLSPNSDTVIHKDANGAILEKGDSVTLIKDLNVKGANFTAKRGTAVRNISLVPDNPEQIEGRVNGQQIVILTQFVKKS